MDGAQQILDGSRPKDQLPFHYANGQVSIKIISS